MFLDQPAHTIEFSVPSSRAHDHILPSPHASLDVADDAMRRGEIDDDLDSGQSLRSNRGCTRVLFGTDDFDSVMAFARDFGNQRPGFSPAEQKKIHGKDDLTTECTGEHREQDT